MSNVRHFEENPRPEQYSDTVHVLSCAPAVPQAGGEGGPNSTVAWKERNVSLQELFNTARTGSISIVFLETPPASRQEEREQVSRSFGVPEDFWTELYQEANSYFGYDETVGQDGSLVRFDTEFRFLCKCNKQKGKAPWKEHSGLKYVWEKMAFYTTWKQDGTFTLLCFDMPDILCRDIIARVKKMSMRCCGSPFFAIDFVVAAMVQNYESAVWEWRDELRKIERMRPRLDEVDSTATKADYIKMHELSRHTTHSTENLASAIETTSTMLDTIQEIDSSYTVRDLTMANRKTRQGLVRQHSMLKSLHNRSKALENRLTSEINLIFHINTQQVAKLAREDSEVSKTIAVLGLLFLPGTLVSAIFSTSFFNFTPGSDDEPARWSVSEKFWIYWVVTGILTALILATWTLWRRWPALKEHARQSHKNRRDQTTGSYLPMSKLYTKS
ncbi:hypothetical protein AMS68_003695 [Peltaster fructicola]|uniref:Uncharacterized protein n=1 Tax=Peltaster fructicola TaxID=286661 RepID=A0A6H0XU86_9PEZI|nr:hypothetical protein AMS68_003695 [Peltaster fructicola]